MSKLPFTPKFTHCPSCKKELKFQISESTTTKYITFDCDHSTDILLFYQQQYDGWWRITRYCDVFDVYWGCDNDYCHLYIESDDPENPKLSILIDLPIDISAEKLQETIQKYLLLC